MEVSGLNVPRNRISRDAIRQLSEGSLFVSLMVHLAFL